MPQMCFAVERFDQSAVVHDQPQFAIKLLGHRPGKIEAPSSNEQDLDSARRGFHNGGAIRLRDFPMAVEQRAVNVHRQKLYGHASILASSRAFRRESSVRSPSLTAAEMDGLP